MSGIKVVISPENASNKNYVVTSSDPSIVKVNKDNTCEAKSAGEVTLTVTTEDGGFVSECKITVKAPKVNVESVSLDTEAAEIVVGDSVTVSE